MAVLVNEVFSCGVIASGELVLMYILPIKLMICMFPTDFSFRSKYPIVFFFQNGLLNLHIHNMYMEYIENESNVFHNYTRLSYKLPRCTRNIISKVPVNSVSPFKSLDDTPMLDRVQISDFQSPNKWFEYYRVSISLAISPFAVIFCRPH